MGMGRPRAFDADAALDRAMDVFWRHGYEGTTIAQLTEAMNINPPSLYAAFGSKEGLLKAALDRYSEKRDAWMEKVLGASTAREVAERFLMEHATPRPIPPTRPAVCWSRAALPAAPARKMFHSNWPRAAPTPKTSCASALSAPRPNAIWTKTPIRPCLPAISPRSHRACA